MVQIRAHLSSPTIGIALSSMAFLLTLGILLSQLRPSAQSDLELGFSALEEIPVQNHDRTIQAFRSALLQDPASPFRWCDLGEAYLITGDLQRAKYCYLQGSALAPHIPAIQLRLCNFQIRAGTFSNASACLAELRKTVPAYREMVFSYYDRFGLSPE